MACTRGSTLLSPYSSPHNPHTRIQSAGFCEFHVYTATQQQPYIITAFCEKQCALFIKTADDANQEYEVTVTPVSS